MLAKRNLQLITPYLVCSLEGVSHGFYLLWLTLHKGISPFAAAAAIAVGDLALLVLEVPTGVFADRLGARRSLLLGSACQVLGLALFWRAGSFPALMAAALAVALGDAFRHGADQALVYRSCAALGDAGSFGRRFARAEAWALAAMMGLTALGGWIAEHAGFDAAWALDVALSLAGLALAWAMTEVPASNDAPDPEPDGEESTAAALAGLRARLPWSLLVPATIVGTLGAIGELLAQTTRRAGLGAQLVTLVIAGALALEALGAALVARGLVPIRARVLDALALAALAGLGLIAIAPALLLPGLLLIFLAGGTAPAIRSALVQQTARDDERATVASAAGAVDMIGKTAGLPLAAWLSERGQLSGMAAVLGGAALLSWALAARRRAA
jgi:predicted MFS family arabinose efflux permease